MQKHQEPRKQPICEIETPGGKRVVCNTIFGIVQNLKAYSKDNTLEDLPDFKIFYMGHRIQLEIDTNKQVVLTNPTELPQTILNHIRGELA